MRKLHMNCRTLALALVAAAALALPGAAHAIAKQYAVEFTCGQSDGAFATPGTYQTAISALNPNTRDANLQVSVVLTVPSRTRSDEVRARLVKGKARTIDCSDIFDGFFTFPEPLPTEGLFKGFLFVQSSEELVVTAHYTASRLDETSSQVVLVPPVPGFFLLGRRNGEVELCHIPPGNPDARHTIVVGAPAVGAHRGHGDYLGSCQDGNGD